MVKINGEELNIDEVNLLSFLLENGYEPGKIAVECNELIVPKAKYEEYVIHSGDVIEIVSFVGGG